MAEFSDYLEQKIIDHFLRNVTCTPATQIFVSLYTDTPGDDDSGTESTGDGYARVQATLTTGTGGTSSNSAAIEFATATASWGTVSHCGLHDAITAGNLLMFSTLDASKTVASGDQFKINIGDLDVSVA